MTLKRLLGIACIALVAACSDNTAPDVGGLSLAKGGNGNGRSSSTETTDASASTMDPTKATDGSDEIASLEPMTCPYADALAGEPCVLRHASDAPPLATLETSFLAVQGRRAQIDFDWSDGEFYGKIIIPRDAQLLDESGQPLAKGESVLITVQLDPDQFLIRFGPHGSTFLGRNPALLIFDVRRADFGTAGPKGTQIWYQPHEGDEWNALASTWDIKNWAIEVPIFHFSNYAVAW